MREVVILFEPFIRLGEDGMELSPQRAVLDIFDFAPELNPAVLLCQISRGDSLARARMRVR
jgi:hypothetical protein